MSGAVVIGGLGSLMLSLACYIADMPPITFALIPAGVAFVAAAMVYAAIREDKL